MAVAGDRFSIQPTSQDAKGEPAPDATDGVMYVITEVAQYSLKELTAGARTSPEIHRERRRFLTPQIQRLILCGEPKPTVGQ